MEQNIGTILNSIVVDNPGFFREFTHETPRDSIMHFIEFINENDHIIKLKETEIKLPAGIINQLRAHFTIID